MAEVHLAMVRHMETGVVLGEPGVCLGEGETACSLDGENVIKVHGAFNESQPQQAHINSGLCFGSVAMVDVIKTCELRHSESLGSAPLKCRTSWLC